jgi:YidC/Oxa1 family membrane protein insertase
MLLQMPVLIAMFSFFPASIELRQQSFLWAADLSTYDAIVSWDKYIPFVSDYFGNHVSLFCLLMTITNLIYTKVNMSMTDTGAQQQMPMMKYMMYFMPVMFLFIFNDYASGLSYYYLLSLLITIVQTYGMRYFIDEEKLLVRLRENQSKPSKRSAWMERLEAEMKRQQELQKQQSQRR